MTSEGRGGRGPRDRDSIEIGAARPGQLRETRQQRPSDIAETQIATYETAEHSIIELDLPGVEKDSISITLEADTLLVVATRTPPTYAPIARAADDPSQYTKRVRFLVPAGTIQQEVSASYKNGVLTILCPRRLPVGDVPDLHSVREAAADRHDSDPINPDRLGDHPARIHRVDLGQFYKLAAEIASFRSRLRICPEQIRETVGGIGSLYLECASQRNIRILTVETDTHLASPIVSLESLLQETANCSGVNRRYSMRILNGIRSSIDMSSEVIVDAEIRNRPVFLPPIGVIERHASAGYVLTVIDAAWRYVSEYLIPDAVQI